MTSAIAGLIAEAVSVPGGLWRPPLLRFAAVDSLDLPWLKKAVAPDHLLPEELLPGAKTLIAFFLPFKAEVVQSNEAPGPASALWAEAYIRTNALINTISGDIESLLAGRGFRAAKVPPTHNFDEKKLVSRWSHRHYAYLAGLGSFGLNNMLITEAGCCGRYGTMVTDWDCGETAAPSPERCLAKKAASAGKPPACGLCQKKCEADAYPGGIFDRHACYAQCLKNAALFKDRGLADVCGKCLIGLPCSIQSP
jgi:epoxyqueuosine reductase QueG